MKRFLPKLGFNIPTFLLVVGLIGLLVFPENAALGAVMLPGIPFGIGMAYVDAQLLFSDAQALTVTAVSTNIIDLGADRNIGIGRPMAIVTQLDVAADAGTADETYTAQLQTDDNAAFSSATSVGGVITITRGNPAGTMFIVPLPIGTETERFLRLNYTLGGTTPSVTVTSYLQPVDMAITPIVHYADNVTIS